MQVSFCRENQCREEVINLLRENHPEYNITENKCIGECGKCTHLYICRVEGKLLESDTAIGLYEQLVQFEKENFS